MVIATQQQQITAPAQHQAPATSPRGRALYTVDWFLNGQPRLCNHDSPATKIADCHLG